MYLLDILLFYQLPLSLYYSCQIFFLDSISGPSYYSSIWKNQNIFYINLKPKQKESPRRYWQLLALDGAIWRWPIALVDDIQRQRRNLNYFYQKFFYPSSYFKFNIGVWKEFLPFHCFSKGYVDSFKDSLLFSLYNSGIDTRSSSELVLMGKSLEIITNRFQDYLSSVFLWFALRTCNIHSNCYVVLTMVFFT